MSTTTTPLLNELLHTLQYPGLKSFDIESKKEVVRVVAWIEDRKVRFYPIDSREALRKANKEWETAFAKYLTDLECPYQWSINRQDKIKVLFWLFSKAISADYEDEGKTFNESFEASKESDLIISAEVIEKLQEIAQQIGVNPFNPTTDNVDDFIKKIEAVVFARFYPSSQTTSTFPPLNNFILGFSTGDELSDRIAVILKMLYLLDLRHLQDDLNSIVATTQEFTANPKTNTALGQVGF